MNELPLLTQTSTASDFERTDSFVHVHSNMDILSLAEEEGDVEYVEEVVYEDVEEEEDEDAEEGAEAHVLVGPPAGHLEPATAAAAAAAAEAAVPFSAPAQPQEVPAAPRPSSELPVSRAATAEPAALTSQAGAEYDLKHLEAHAAKVAKDVQEAAKGVQQQLAAGLQSMLGGVGGTAAASAGLRSVAGGLSNWWSSLDPVVLPKLPQMAERIQQSSSKASDEVQAMFGLGAEESLVEVFTCKLLQTYGCSHNTFTPAIQMAFSGQMYITSAHTCFSVEERGRKLPFKVAHAQTVKATRQRPARKGDLSDILRLDTGAGTWLAFKDFDSSRKLDDALSLVEHLMESA